MEWDKISRNVSMERYQFIGKINMEWHKISPDINMEWDKKRCDFGLEWLKILLYVLAECTEKTIHDSMERRQDSGNSGLASNRLSRKVRVEWAEIFLHEFAPGDKNCFHYHLECDQICCYECMEWSEVDGVESIQRDEKFYNEHHEQR